MPAASYREVPDGHSSRKQKSKRRRAKRSPSFVSGRVIGHCDISPRCIPECSAMALHRAVPAARPSRASTLSFVLLAGAFSKSCLRCRFFFAGRAAVIWCGANPGVRPWQDLREMRSRATGSDKISPRCVPRRSTMAKCSRSAPPPSIWRWRDCALMRSWPDWQRQYSRAVRSQGSCRGKIPPRCVPGHQSVASFALHASRKRPRTGKSPVRGKIRAPCIRNELALAGYARHASEKPCKQPFGDTPREDLAMKGPLSLHGPLESCTARRSCHPSWRQTARAPATPAPPNSVSRQS